MKALVIAPQPFFSPRGTPFSVYYRALVMSSLGVEIDLLTYGEGQDVDIPGIRIIRIPYFSWFGNVKTGPSLLKLFLDVLISLWTFGLLLRNRYDFVHAHEEAVFFCSFLKPIFRYRLIYDMHSSLPQQLTNFNFSKSKLLIGIFEKLEYYSIRTSDAIITICPALADYVNQIIGATERHLLIENSIFENVRINNSKLRTRSSEQTINLAKVQSSLPRDKRFVVYAGTLEHYQGIDLLIEAFSHVVQDQPDVFLLIVGGEPGQVRHYCELAQRMGIDNNVLFTGRVPQSLAIYYTNIATVLVSPRREGTNTPLKIYQQLASGIPLVATKIYSHTQILDDRVAFLVSPEPNDLARGINEALNSEKGRLSRIENARRLYETKYSRQAYETKIIQLLELIK